MVSMAFEFLTWSLPVSLFRYGRGNRMLMRDAEVTIPLVFSYQPIGATGLTCMNSFLSCSYAFPLEKKCTSCPFCSSRFPIAVVRDACPRPSSEQAYSSLINHNWRNRIYFIIPLVAGKQGF